MSVRDKLPDIYTIEDAQEWEKRYDEIIKAGGDVGPLAFEFAIIINAGLAKEMLKLEARIKVLEDQLERNR